MAGSTTQKAGDTLVHYERESDGTVQSVNEGTPEHGVLRSSDGWTKTTRAKAEAFEPRPFVSTSKRKAAEEKAKAEAAEKKAAEKAEAEAEAEARAAEKAKADAAEKAKAAEKAQA